MNKTDTKKKNLYGNWQVQAPDGELLSIGTKKRAKWYLDRGFADLISNEPPTIRLKFEPRGRDTDKYNLQKKHNRCVVCGSKKIKDLTKHHVIPSMYRRLFPIEFKERSSHDVVVICRTCHDEYESQHADKLKKMFAENFDAPLHAVPRNIAYKGIMIARTIVNRWDSLPGDRVEELIEDFEDITGIDPNSFEELYSYIESQSSILEKLSEKETHPQKVVVAFKDNLNQFAIMWRQNFIDKMAPKFMPEGWDVQRELGQ